MHPEFLQLIEQAWGHQEGDFAAGLALAEQAAEEAESRADLREQAQAGTVRGFFLLRLERAAEARSCLSAGLEMSRIAGDRDAEASCLYSLGMERYKSEEHKAALDYCFQSEPLYDVLENRREQAKVLNSIGSVYFMLDDHNQAIHFYLRAFRLREALGDLKEIACSLNNIGNAYVHFGEYERSVGYYEQCLAACRGNALVGLEALCLSNLSESYTHLGQIPKAVETAQASLEISRERGDTRKQWYALQSMGRAYCQGRQYTEAISVLTEALAFARADSSRRVECEAQVLLGEAFLSADRVAEAHAAFADAEKIASALGLLPLGVQALRGLSKVYEHQEDFSAALTHHKQCYALEKALDTEAADKRSKTLMIQMEVEKVQKEAQLHQLKNVELAALNTALEEANQRLQTQAQEMQAQAALLEAQGRELQAQAGELHRQATEDGLTGLANRRHLETWLAGQFQETRRSGRPLTLAMADVDHFKQVNDRFGHQIGDEVLMFIGMLLRHACRASDLAARYGGEEFVLVLPETDACAARAVCERLRQTVEKHPWQTIHPDLSVTISLGLSEGPSENPAAENPTAESYERLLGQADAQLYHAKNAGRNRVHPAAPTGTLLR